jgi:hypothetical protein
MATQLERAPVASPAERAAQLSKLAGLQRWTRRMGYAACAWGLFFTLEHVYWVCGGSWLVSTADTRNAASFFAQHPWSYVMQAVLLCALFAILALFPLALTWQGKQIKQRTLQGIVLICGYVGLILMAAYSFATQASVLGLACLGMCVLGVGVAFVRPRTQSAVRWQVLVATWMLGAGMTLYGGMWILTALLNSHAVYLPEYLVAGGMNWTIEGLLFVTVAWLARSSERIARQTMRSQPD